MKRLRQLNDSRHRAIQGPPHADDLRDLRVLVGQVRAKIERDATDPKITRTERGVDYRFTTE
jgi:two-component system KDP operon response regulator KdpE